MSRKKKKKVATGATKSKKKGQPRSKKNIIETHKSKIVIYASPKISRGMDIIGEMTIFEGVKVLEVIEAAYVQGKKDGARAAFEQVQTGFVAAQKAIPHKNPGKPKKR